MHLIFISSVIVVGTINQKTVDKKLELSQKGYKIIHADDFRNRGMNYSKASKIALLKFILETLLCKKIAFFTSKTIFLNNKFKIIINFLNQTKKHVHETQIFKEEGKYSFEILDCRENKMENIIWVKNLSKKDIKKYLPKYFERDKNQKFSSFSGVEKIRRVYLFELKENYSDDRFL